MTYEEEQAGDRFRVKCIAEELAGQSEDLAQISRRVPSLEAAALIGSAEHRVRAAFHELAKAARMLDDQAVAQAREAAHRPRWPSAEEIEIGYWTQTGDVFCHEHLMAHDERARRQMHNTTPQRVRWRGHEHFSPTRCHGGCDRWIAVRYDVALLNNMREVLGAGRMRQTGGMCSALAFGIEDDASMHDTMIWVSHNGPEYCIGRYKLISPAAEEDPWDWDNPEVLGDEVPWEKALAVLRAAMPWIKGE